MFCRCYRARRLTLASLPGIIYGMGANKTSKRACEMYALYEQGLSLQQVGAVFGITRQSVYDTFKYHGLKCRAKVFQPTIEFNGAVYSLKSTGYFTRTNGERHLLHRDMWEHHFGPIPDGWDIHHKDENKANNTIENFECIPKADHTRCHNPKRPTEVNACLQCGEDIIRHPYEGPTAYRRKKFCQRKCAYDWLRGKPKGPTPNS
jgi:hypothetical protein